MSNNIIIQPSKLRTKNWVEINDNVLGPYSTNNQIKFKTILRSTFLYIVMFKYLRKEL